MTDQYTYFFPLAAGAPADESCGCGSDCRCGPGCACGSNGKCAPACTCAD
jgi:hypothetical protein